MDALSEAKDACEKLQGKDLLSPDPPSYSAKVPEAAMEADKEIIVENSRPATSSDDPAAADENARESTPEFTRGAVAEPSFKDHRFCLEKGAVEADKESTTQNAPTVTCHDGDVSKKDALEVKNPNPGEAAANGIILREVAKFVSEFSVAIVTEACAADEFVEEFNPSERLARLIEAESGSIPQAVLDHSDDFLDDMMAETFEMPVDEIKASPFFATMKAISRGTAAEYMASKNTAERLAKHEATLAFFRGTGTCPDPPPISVLASIGNGGVPVLMTCFNPLYDAIWLPWAKKAQFIDHEEIGMLIADREEVVNGLRQRIIGTMFSYAVPSRQVLEYMVQRAPDGKIAELGAGSGYWAALLQRLGADIVAVDNGSEEIYARGSCFPARIKQDGTDFLKGGGADGRVLFLCWPRHIDENSAVLSFLENYSGDTVFFVGEIGHRGAGATFDIVHWADEHQDEGWEVEEMFPIPTWPGIHDVFVCVSKKVSQDQSSVQSAADLALQ